MTLLKANKYSVAWLLVLLASFQSIEAQDSAVTHTRPLYAHASFFYDFPQSFGITGGISRTFKAILKTKRNHTRQKDRFLALDGGVFRYPLNYTGVLLMPGYGTRHYRTKSFFYETTVNIGLLRTFYDGRVYEVEASGNVEEKKYFGRFYATTHIAAAFDFAMSKAAWFELKPSLWFQYPFDSFVKPHLSLEAGIKFQVGKK